MTGTGPKGWVDYCDFKEIVSGTRFLPFRTPLTKQVRAPGGVYQIFTPRMLYDRVENLGCIINLRKTNASYDIQYFRKANIPVYRLKLDGHAIIPEQYEINAIFEVIDHFMEKNVDDKRKLIGVHCTHGVNRTGYIICRYMIDRLGVEPEVAINTFESCRGHTFDHQEYVDHLLELIPRKNEKALAWHSVEDIEIFPKVYVEEEVDMEFVKRTLISKGLPVWSDRKEETIKATKGDHANGAENNSGEADQKPGGSGPALPERMDPVVESSHDPDSEPDRMGGQLVENLIEGETPGEVQQDDARELSENQIEDDGQKLDEGIAGCDKGGESEPDENNNEAKIKTGENEEETEDPRENMVTFIGSATDAQSGEEVDGSGSDTEELTMSLNGSPPATARSEKLEKFLRSYSAFLGPYKESSRLSADYSNILGPMREDIFLS